MRKYFYPSATYDEAIRSNDKAAIKTLLIGIIGSDPTFETTEYEEASSYIEKKYKEFHGDDLKLTQEYAEQEDEYNTEDINEWTEEYFGLNLVWLRDNFAMNKRLERIKRVGAVAFKNKQTLGKAKKKQFEASEKTIKKNKVVPITTSDNRSKWMLFIIGLVVIILIVFFFYFSVKGEL